MAELKTQENDASVEDYLAKVAPPRRAEDARTVMAMMARITGETPRMWGTSIIGFGRYGYQNSKGKDFSWPLTGVSPRKAALSIYIMPGFEPFGDLMAKLGTHKTGRSCLYVTRLENIDIRVLERLIAGSVELMRARYPG